MTSPLEAMRTDKAEGHLSDFAIDALVADEAADENRERQRTHLATCDKCRARLDSATKDAAQFARAAPVLMFSRKKKVNRTPVLFAVASALALAAGVMLFVRSRPSPDEGALTTRLKGGSHIGFFVKRGDVVTTGTSGARVQPGDALRFTYGATKESHLAILSVDGAKNVSVYFPDAPTAAPIAPGVDHALPSSTVLDDTLGHETIYALFCDSPIALEPVRARLAAAPGRAPVVEGCTVDTLTIDKDAASVP